MDCSICLNKIDTNSSFIKLKNCDHLYCKSCIFEWILIKNNCPYCRIGVSDNEISDACDYGILNNTHIKVNSTNIILSNLNSDEYGIIINYIKINDFLKKTEWKILMNKIIKDQKILNIFIKTKYIKKICYFKKNEDTLNLLEGVYYFTIN